MYGDTHVVRFTFDTLVIPICLGASYQTLYEPYNSYTCTINTAAPGGDLSVLTGTEEWPVASQYIIDNQPTTPA